MTILMIGTKTEWGEIVGVTNRGGERYYFIKDESNSVSLMPALIVEG